MRASRVSSSLPAAPTNGSPWRSSLKPGASPTIMMSAGHGPIPGTAWVLVACSPHLVQARTSAWRALSDFDACFERDQVARLSNGEHDRVELVLCEWDQGKAERPRWEAHGVEHRLDRYRVGRCRHQGLDDRQQPQVDLS